MADNFIVHDVPISGLASAGSVSGSDLVVISQGGVHKKATVSQVASGESAVTAVTGSAGVLSSGGASPVISLAVYNAAGTQLASTYHAVKGSVTAAGASTTVTLAGSAVFADATYAVFLYDNAAPQTLIAVTPLAGSFTFTSTSTHVYTYIAFGA